MQSWGDIQDQITAQVSIGSVVSGGQIIASVTPSPSVSLIEYDHDVFSDYPADPNFSDAELRAKLNELLRDLEQEVTDELAATANSGLLTLGFRACVRSTNGNVLYRAGCPNSSPSCYQKIAVI